MSTPKHLDWPEIAKRFSGLIHFLVEDGVMAPPDRGVVPSREIEDECDAWSRIFAAFDLSSPVMPPDHVRSWMIARAAVLAALARQLAKQKTPPPELFDQKTMEHFLIFEWHHAGRKYWLGLGDLPISFSS